MTNRAHHTLVRRGFTLVEILIVVVILGILAAIVTALFNTTVDDAAQQATANELAKLRRHVEVYKIRHGQALPAVEEGDGSWGPLVGAEHFLSPPVNAWVGGPNARVIVFGAGPDMGYQRDYGWIYDPINGQVWAGGFDEHDKPYERQAAVEEQEEGP